VCSRVFHVFFSPATRRKSSGSLQPWVMKLLSVTGRRDYEVGKIKEAYKVKDKDTNNTD